MPAGFPAHGFRILASRHPILSNLERIKIGSQRALPGELIQHLPTRSFSHYIQHILVEELLRRDAELRRPSRRARSDQRGVQLILLRREPAQGVQIVQHPLLHPVAAGGKCVGLRLVANDARHGLLQLLHGPALLVVLCLAQGHVQRVEANVLDQLLRIGLRRDAGGIFRHRDADLPAGLQRGLILLCGGRRIGNNLIRKAGLVQHLRVDIDIRDRALLCLGGDDLLECLAVALQGLAGGGGGVECNQGIGALLSHGLVSALHVQISRPHGDGARPGKQQGGNRCLYCCFQSCVRALFQVFADGLVGVEVDPFVEVLSVCCDLLLQVLSQQLLANDLGDWHGRLDVVHQDAKRQSLGSHFDAALRAGISKRLPDRQAGIASLRVFASGGNKAHRRHGRGHRHAGAGYCWSNGSGKAKHHGVLVGTGGTTSHHAANIPAVVAGCRPVVPTLFCNAGGC